MAPDQSSKDSPPDKWRPNSTSLRPLKITGEKFTITIPKNWRDSHGLTRGDSLIPSYTEGSALILNPRNMDLSEVEVALINLLIEYPKMDKGRELALKLVEIGQKILQS